MHLDGRLLFCLICFFLIGGKGGRDESAIYEPSLFYSIRNIVKFSFWFFFGRRKKKSRWCIEVKMYKKKKNFHPVFEKLEFYLNLKNDFALTFIRDELRVYFFSKKKKIPKSFPKRDSWKRRAARRHRDSHPQRFPLFPSFVFGFCKMYEKESFDLFFWFLV